MNTYFNGIRRTLSTAGYTELSFYGHFQRLFQNALNHQTSGVQGWHLECNVNSNGNYPDFTIYDAEGDIRARIEAKKPEETINEAFFTNHSDQLVKYLNPENCGHPNLIVTNFIQFRVVSLNDDGAVEQSYGEDGSLDLFANIDEMPDNLNVDQRTELTETFRELIQIVTNMDAHPIVDVHGLRRLLGQLIKSVADWFFWAWNPDEKNISYSQRQWANFLSNLATNIVHEGDLSNDEKRQKSALMMGQLFATGLIIVESEAQRIEHTLEEELQEHQNQFDLLEVELEGAAEEDVLELQTQLAALNTIIDERTISLYDEEMRLERRNVRTEILPSERHNLCFQQMALFSHFTGNEKLLALCQRSLSLVEAGNLLNSEAIEEHFQVLMRNEFPEWIQDYGMVPTEEQVVRYMVRRADMELRRMDPERFGEEGILTDNPETGVRARILDPACGTGRFYIGVLEEIWRLSLAQTPEPEGEEDIARSRILRAIGTTEVEARVHALDIQPMCVMLTQVLLRRFLIDHGIDYQNIQTSIHIRNSLRHVDLDIFNPNPDFVNAVNGPFEIVLGNPPYGASALSAAVATDQERIKVMLDEWIGPYRAIYRELTGNPHATGAKAEIAFAFLKKYRTLLRSQENPSILCFITPSTLNWSPNWVGAREMLIQEDSVIVDSLGGQVNPLGDDGQNVFGARCPSANSIYTLRFDGSSDGVIMRQIYPEHTTTEEKLAHMAQCAENLPDLVADYPHTFTQARPPFSYFSAPGETVGDGPQMGRIWYRGDDASGNDSGMLPIRRTGYRFAIANRQHLESEVVNFFGSASREDGRGNSPLSNFFADGLHEYGDDEQMNTTFDRINPPFQDSDFATVSMSAMNHIHVFVPFHADQASLCWDDFRQAREPVSTEGYLIIPLYSKKRPAEHGFHPFASRYISGHNHAANHNGRCIPYTLQIGDNTAPNLSDFFIEWLGGAQYDVENTLQLTVNVWDHVLNVLSSEQFRPVTRLIDAGGSTLYQVPIPFPAGEEVFHQSARVGNTLRMLQRIQPPQDPDHLTRYNALRNFLFPRMRVYRGNGVVPPADVRIQRKKINSKWQVTGFETTAEEGDHPDQGNLETAAEAFGMNVDEFLEAIGGFQQLGLGPRNQDGICQRLRWTPGIALNFELGNNPVIKKWMAWHSNLDPQLPQQAFWTNAVAINWYNQLREIIVNLTMQSLLRKEINDTTQEVLDADLIEWVEPAPPEEVTVQQDVLPIGQQVLPLHPNE